MSEVPAETSPPPDVRRRRWLALTIIIAAAGVVLGVRGVMLVGEYLERRRREVPAPTESVTAVRTFEVVPCDVPAVVEATGFLRSPATLRIAAETQGLVKRKAVKEGQAVRQGDVIAVIDDELSRVRLEAGKARERAWKARLDFLGRELDRIRKLVDTDSLGGSELDKVSSEMREVEAHVEESAARISELEITLRKREIRAPRDGVWYRDAAKEGEYLQIGQNLGLLRVIDPLELPVEVSGTVRLALVVGHRLDIELLDVDETLGGPDRFRPACRILRMPAGSDEASRRFPVVIEVPNPGGGLIPGLFARVRLEIPRGGPVVLIPKECVFDRFGRSAVYVVTAESDGGHRADARFLSVRQLKDRPESWRVLEGLSPGARVVLSPIEQLYPGARVSVESER